VRRESVEAGAAAASTLYASPTLAQWCVVTRYRCPHRAQTIQPWPGGFNSRPLPSALLPVGCRLAVLGSEFRDHGFQFTGTVTGRAPLPEETTIARTGVVDRLEHRRWTDHDRATARELQAEGFSWSQIAERVCPTSATRRRSGFG
jgi:hypothetical protein